MKTGTFLTLSLLGLSAGVAAYDCVPGVSELFNDKPAPARTARADKEAKKAGKPATAARKDKAKPVEKAARKAQQLPTVIPGSYIGTELSGKEWADTAALQKKLGESILIRLKGTDPASVASFMAEPANRLMLAQWHLAAAENAVSSADVSKLRAGIAADVEKRKATVASLREQLTRATGLKEESLTVRLKAETSALRAREAELASPRSMKEALSSTPGAAGIISQVTNNLDWMEQIVYSGECRNPGRAMAILAAIAANDKKLAYKKMQREIATATAIEWAKSGWEFAKALPRAAFYTENWEDERLHTEFDTVPFWMRRVICGCKGDNAYGEVESLRWQLDNVNLPTERYAGSCWQCAYRLNNFFGDSIHGPMYYNPYAEVEGYNAATRTYNVGGVCGGLSHYGAFAALANGIPALTAGEPGHCAYIVYSNNKWQPGYSLSWQRGLHWQVWSGIHKFASLHMATELFSEEQLPQTSLANALWTLAKLHAEKGDLAEAEQLFLDSVQKQPRNYIAWRDYAGFLAKHKPQDAAAWKQLNAAASETIVPLYPEMAAELMKRHVYPAIVQAKMSSGDVAECFAAFWKPLKGMGPDRWDIESLCGAQADVLKKLSGKADESSLALYEKVLGLCSGKEAYAPVILSWGNGMASGMKPEMQQRFLKATLSGLSSGGDMDATARDRMLGQALSGAAKMRDRSSFQAIGKMLSENYKKNILPKWEPFPGKLASQGGLLRTSSSSHDDPAAHWGVLEPTGGRFHTGNEENPWAVVEMPKTVYVTGVVVISTSGQNVRRLHDMKVQYSESGRDDDWHDAGAFPAPSTKAINRLDLQNSKPRARFIRIVRGGGKDFFHLNAILVYGEQAA